MPGLRSSLLVIVFMMSAQAAEAARCVYISSYHKGYAWSDGVERGLLKTLDGHCEITRFDMDSKRNKDEASIQQAALEAKALIDATQPDVVIASDDNASKYLIVPYYKDAEIPFVFCGVNWTVEQYGYPFSNVTGMIEVAAIGLVVLLVSISAGLSVTHALRWGLCCVVGGLVGYNLYALGVQGMSRISRYSKQWGALLATTLGCLVTILLGVVWMLIRRRMQRKSPDSRSTG